MSDIDTHTIGITEIGLGVFLRSPCLATRDVSEAFLKIIVGHITRRNPINSCFVHLENLIGKIVGLLKRFERPLLAVHNIEQPSSRRLSFHIFYKFCIGLANVLANSVTNSGRCFLFPQIDRVAP